MKSAMALIGSLGWRSLGSLRIVYGMFELLADTVVSILGTSKRTYSASFRQIVNQILFTGVDALGIVSVIALLCGVTIVIQALTIGVNQYFAKIMIVTIVRELGPFFTSVVVTGRSGAALAAYIGNMKVCKEVAALQMMGIDPVHFLVMPAFIGMIISMICLNVYFDFIAVFGGLALVQVSANIRSTRFIEYLTVGEILVPLLKSIIGGAVVSIMACYFGLSVENIREVSRSVHKAVVWSMVTTIFINVLFTVAVYA
jgi:phospholipid/cholesterol/gamma-HCH transport system permease protein